LRRFSGIPIHRSKATAMDTAGAENRSHLAREIFATVSPRGSPARPLEPHAKWDNIRAKWQ
jgi:hypothetical protein